LEEFLEMSYFIVRLLVSIIVSSVKACLPMGVLPRKNVSGGICLITGAGHGIGRLMAVEFARLGCVMVLWDVNTAGNEETPEMVRRGGATVHTYTIDLSKREQMNATAERVKKEVGDVDILINNAGVVTGKKLLDSPDELIQLTMNVNALACLFTAKNFEKSLIDRNHGHVGRHHRLHRGQARRSGSGRLLHL
ncbi:hypothetical protein PMAYCL1PPCAC_05958, partial [Pristionchus mayeri]